MYKVKKVILLLKGSDKYLLMKKMGCEKEALAWKIPEGDYIECNYRNYKELLAAVLPETKES